MKVFNQIILFVITPLYLSNGFGFSPINSNHRIHIHNSYQKYPFSKNYYESYLKRLNSLNFTEHFKNHFHTENETPKPNPGPNTKSDNNDDDDDDDDEDEVAKLLEKLFKDITNNNNNDETPREIPFDKQPRGHPHTQPRGIRIIMDKETIQRLSRSNNLQNEDNGSGGDDDEEPYYGRKTKKSENFEVVSKSPVTFKDVGGYDNIKKELEQCIDILTNYKKYQPYNVRVPKGLILEGPPGNGKTLLAKALAGEAKTAFIAVSGAEFQEKYVGVGASRIRELFKLAKENTPCIVFIDEIDALGRKRSKDGDTSGNERDNTLNELLVALDGFKNTSGIFLIGATNRADLLDSALLRPGRVDKRIFIGNPDSATRKSILNIHSKGKPHDSKVIIDDIVEITNGLSGAQIENLVNEAMLNALRYNRTEFTNDDLEVVMNKMMVGWQPNEHQFTKSIVDQIAIHELGHAVVGLLSKHHSKMTKVVINLSAPKSPAYTVFESSNSDILTREALFEHLMILLAGRIAEEVFYGISVSTGAINDFEEALKLAERMICYYGMGKNLIYPSNSDKYKEIIDTEVSELIQDAYGYAEFLVRNSKDFIQEGAELLKQNKIVKAETLVELINTKYKNVLHLKI
jgi:cell division protease FtsH